MNGEEGLEYDVYVDGVRLEHDSVFKYLGCVLDEAGIDGAEYSRKVATGRRVANVISSLVNVRNFQLKFARLLHETLLVPVLMYGCKTIFWKEKERFRVRGLYRWTNSEDC